MSTPRIVPTNAALGARIEGLDRTEIARPEIAAMLQKALGSRFPASR